MLNYQVTIGLAPMRRNVSARPSGSPFAWDSAERREEEVISYIEEHFANENVRFVNTKGLGCNNLMFDNASMQEFATHFQAQKVDAVMLINCNFGNEEIAGDLAAILGKPVLIWAPLDEEFMPDGTRTTDSQCGIFGISRQLQRLHIPFSHLPTCKVDSPEFREGLERFVRVCCMVKNFKGMRIGQVGCRPTPFCSVIINEGELLETFGIRIIPINMALIAQRMETAEAQYPEEIKRYAAYFTENYAVDQQTQEYIQKMAALAAVYVHLFEEFQLDVLSAECWTATPHMFGGLAPCAVNGMLCDMGYLVACETDIHLIITAALLKCATLGQGTPLQGEFTIRHPENKNAELLWHCGPFALSQKAKDSEAKLVNQRQWFRAKDGFYTMARLDQESGKYMILPLTCKTTTGPHTSGTYMWAEFEDLQAVEDRLIQGPYIHHFAEIEGDWRKELQEFCKYVPQIKLDQI